MKELGLTHNSSITYILLSAMEGNSLEKYTKTLFSTVASVISVFPFTRQEHRMMSSSC